MNEELLDEIVSAVLSKGQAGSGARRIDTSSFTVGCVYPRSFSEARAREGAEPCLMQSECVLQHRDYATVDVRVRFQHPLVQEVYAPARSQESGQHGKPAYGLVPWLVTGDQCYRTRQEIVEREVRLVPVWVLAGRSGSVRAAFSYPAMSDVKLLPDEHGGVAGAVVWRQEALRGTVEAVTQPARAGCMKIKVRISNETPTPHGADADMVLMRTLVSTHIVLKAEHGVFLSVARPGEYQELVNTCENIGTWPVLVGEQGGRACDTVVSSPVMPDDFHVLAARRL